jgi:hypothetical protein
MIKNILVLIGAGAIVYFVYNKYGKTPALPIVTIPPVDEKKKAQFDGIIEAFSKGGNNVFQTISPSMYDKSLRNFAKNVSDDDANFMMDISAKKQSDMTPAEQIRLVTIITKMLGGNKK